MDDPALANCPFCDEPVRIENLMGSAMDSGRYIVCPSCKRALIYADAMGIEIWNRRPAESALRMEIERLQKQVERLGWHYNDFPEGRRVLVEFNNGDLVAARYDPKHKVWTMEIGAVEFSSVKARRWREVEDDAD